VAENSYVKAEICESQGNAIKASFGLFFELSVRRISIYEVSFSLSGISVPHSKV